MYYYKIYYYKIVYIIPYHIQYSCYRSIKLLFPCQSTDQCHLSRLCLGICGFFCESYFACSLFFSMAEVKFCTQPWSFASCLGRMPQRLLWCCNSLQGYCYGKKSKFMSEFCISKKVNCQLVTNLILGVLQLPKWMKMSKKFAHLCLKTDNIPLKISKSCLK